MWVFYATETGLGIWICLCVMVRSGVVAGRGWHGNRLPIGTCLPASAGRGVSIGDLSLEIKGKNQLLFLFYFFKSKPPALAPLPTD